MKINTSYFLRYIFILSVIFSITLMYYVFVVKKQYTVFTNPEGPVMFTDNEDLEI